MKRLIIILVLLLSLTLTGCIQEYNLTEEQADAVAEYAAGILLENDASYDQKLIPMGNNEADSDTGDSSSKDEEKTSSITPKDSDIAQDYNTANTSDNQKKYTLSEVIGNDSFEIQYKDYMLTSSYPKEPENDAFSLDAREGYQLLVIMFDVTNLTNRNQRLNLSDAEIIYQLDINEGTVYKPELTFQENDLHFIDITVGRHKTVEALLIFEVSKDIDISDMDLLISRDNKSEIIKIK